MSTMISDADLNDSGDPTEAAAADRRLDVRFSVEKRLNHAANTRVAEHNNAIDEKAVLLDHAHKFDDAKTLRSEKLPDDPIYRDIEFVTIKIPGDNTMNVHRPIMASDKQRFRAQYERFKSAKGEALEGAPIATLPGIKDNTIRDLTYVGITTIEQLAAVSDSSAITQMMGINSLKQQAKSWVAKNRKSSLVNQTNEALAERDTLIAALTARLDALETKPAAKAAK